MNLLTAINLILPKLGEHPVTSLNSRSPTMAVLLPIFDRLLRDTQIAGWWYNTHRTTLYHNPTTGEIGVAENTLSFVADCERCSVRKNRLHDSENNTFEWFRPVKGTIITAVAFDELPESAAALVYAAAAVEACVTDLGLTDEVRMWQAMAAEAEARRDAEHLRNMKHSTTRSSRYMRYRAALRG